MTIYMIPDKTSIGQSAAFCCISVEKQFYDFICIHFYKSDTDMHIIHIIPHASRIIISQNCLYSLQSERTFHSNGKNM